MIATPPVAPRILHLPAMRRRPDPAIPFAMEDFEAHQGEILLHLGEFFLYYLHRLREAFSGDLTMAIILGEIGHHNSSSFFPPGEGMHTELAPDERFESMACCNAHSLSASTGIPRETIRRKIDVLIDRGWVEKIQGKGLRITPACVAHFSHSFNVPTLCEFLVTSRTIERILDREGARTPESR